MISSTIKIYLSSRYSKHIHPNTCPSRPPRTINFKIFNTGNFLQVYATKKSVVRYNGNKIAIASLGGNIDRFVTKYASKMLKNWYLWEDFFIYL